MKHVYNEAANFIDCRSSFWAHKFFPKYVSLGMEFMTKTVPYGGFNTLRPRQNGHHFPDDILKCIFLNENV